MLEATLLLPAELEVELAADDVETVDVLLVELLLVESEEL